MHLKDLAAAIGGTAHGDTDMKVARPIHPAEATNPTDIAIALAPALVALLPKTVAEAAIIPAGAVVPPGAVRGWISVGQPRRAMVDITGVFAQPPEAPLGVHPQACIGEGVEIGAGVSIGPFVHIGSGARIGSGSRILSHATVGEGAVLGDGALIHPGVRIGPRVVAGHRLIVHANAVIGADGFSFVTPQPGSVEAARDSGVVDEQRRNHTIERVSSVGTVILGDDVEIGALATIDRATLGATRIGDGTKIDNLVLVGHNVVIGQNCMLCGQVGLAGSVRLGDRVVLAGKVGVADHVMIGDDVVCSGGTMVGTNVAPRTVLMGVPGVPREEFLRQYRFIRRLGSLFAEVAGMRGVRVDKP